MDRNTAQLVAITAAKEALRAIAPCFVGHGQLEDRRKQLINVRDRLFDACTCFESSEACQVEEDIYLPLFDALSFMTVCVGVKPIKMRPLKLARKALETIIFHAPETNVHTNPN